MSEVYHNVYDTGDHERVDAPAPDRRSYASFASFTDPDGNGWLLREVKERQPGR